MTQQLRHEFEGFDANAASRLLMVDVADQPINEYIGTHSFAYRDSAANSSLGGLSHSLEIVERLDGEFSPYRRSARMFGGGAALALRSVELAYSMGAIEEITLKDMEAQTDYYSGGIGRGREWRAQVRAIRTQGQLGLGLAEPLHYKLHDWSHDSATDSLGAEHMRIGFGYVFKAIANKHDARATQALEALLKKESPVLDV